MTDTNLPELPDPRPPQRHPLLMDVSFACLGWLNRAAQAVGSERFFESLERAQFYLDRTQSCVSTPAERAVWQGLYEALGGLIDADRAARRTLAESCQEMAVADIAEFVELAENQD